MRDFQQSGGRRVEIRHCGRHSHAHLRAERFADDNAFGAAIFSACREVNPDLVVMAGFLKFAPVPVDFANRVMNIHPALIPAFCGRGAYGLRVHRAVLEYGAKISGCTVHFVDNEYDHGPIILQRVVPVAENDTPELLAAGLRGRMRSLARGDSIIRRRPIASRRAPRSRAAGVMGEITGALGDGRRPPL